MEIGVQNQLVVRTFYSYLPYVSAIRIPNKTAGVLSLAFPSPFFMIYLKLKNKPKTIKELIEELFCYSPASYYYKSVATRAGRTLVVWAT